ncbi:MAG: 5'-methylthioadenosine/adenosylhomocysteine nucleosidase [Bacteroidales bacterium]
MQEKIIGIMGAMPEETAGVVTLLKNRKETSTGMRTYYEGEINGIKSVVVFSRWGKVAAATTATVLINQFKVTEIIFCGVAGALAPDLKVGDIVVGKQFIQHDMDSRPILKQYELPFIKKTFIECRIEQLERATKAVEQLLDPENLHNSFLPEELAAFQITNPKMRVGDIASGDQFFANTEQKEALLHHLPTISCVEMEGAAVAQVCYEYDIPLTVIRTISDSADEQSPLDFPSFLKKIASQYSMRIIENIYQNQ